MDLPILIILFKWIIQCMCFCDWLLSPIIMFSRFIQCISTSLLLWLYNIPLHEQNIFIHSTIDTEHSSCIYFVVTMNNAAMNICVCVDVCFPMFPPRAGLAVSYVQSMLNILKNVTPFFKNQDFSILIRSVWRFQFLHIFNTCYCLFFFLLQPSWSIGNKQRSFCHFWDCTQVLHFGLFCWLWWLLYFF